MIELTAKIGSQKKLVLNSASSTCVSWASELSSVINAFRNTKNIFFLDSTILNGNTNFAPDEKVSYFVSQEVSDEDGKFEKPISIYFEDRNEDIKDITIAFNTNHNRHPQTIVVNSKTYNVNSSVFTITDIPWNPEPYVHLEIKDINIPNCPLEISWIVSGNFIEIDKTNIISLENTVYDRADMKLPSFGLISNSGIIKFADAYGVVAAYNNAGLLSVDTPCEIYLTNTRIEQSKPFMVMKTKNWSYDSNSKIVTVELTDGLEKLQDIYLKDFSIDIVSPKTYSFYDLYYRIRDELESYGISVVYSDETFNSSLYKMLYNKKIKYLYYKEKTAWDLLQDLAEVCQLHIFVNNENKIDFKYNGGN